MWLLLCGLVLGGCFGHRVALLLPHEAIDFLFNPIRVCNLQRRLYLSSQYRFLGRLGASFSFPIRI